MRSTQLVDTVLTGHRPEKYTHARATREGVHRGVRQAASNKQQ